MKVSDLIKLSLHNLWRRKLRTALTVSGVMIGTTSIVVMMSIAIGQTAYFYEMMNQNNELTTIEGRSGNRRPGGRSGGRRKGPGGPGAGKLPPTEKILNDQAVQELAALPGVDKAYPVLEKPVYFKCGAYINPYAQVVALPQAGLDDLQMKVRKADGSEAAFNSREFAQNEIEFLVGKEFGRNFYLPKQRDFDYENGAKIDFLHNSVVYFLDPEAMNRRNQPETEGIPAGESKPLIIPRRRAAHFYGIMQPKSKMDFRSTYMIYTRLETLTKELKKEFRGRGFDQQKLSKSGRWSGDITYSCIKVRTDSLTASQKLVDVIKNLGYEAHSNASFINEMQKQQQRAQTLFGSIGGIALLVAAIGIANTMMMAIYERTKEIGVFKVLGCPIGRIRNMFLLEAGSIGFIGGSFGLLLSTLLSLAMNKLPIVGMLLGSMAAMGGENVRVSIIPLWLYGFALLFATLIGALAGLLPALKAMRLSALEALRTE